MMTTINSKNKFVKKREYADDFAISELKSMFPVFLSGNGLVLLVSGVLGLLGLFGFVNVLVDWRVLTGLLLGNALCVFNFRLIGMTVGSVVRRREPRHARAFSHFSYFARYSVMFALYGVLIYLNLISMVAGVVPLFFPRIHYTLKAILNKEV